MEFPGDFWLRRDPGRTRDGVRQFAEGCLKFRERCVNHGLRAEGGWFVFLNMSELCWISTHYSLQPSFNHERQNAFLSYFCLIRRAVAFTTVG